MSRILYSKPSITELEISYATDAATYGWGERCYEYINRFENSFSNHLDTPFAIATSSCTGALHMGLSALGIGPGDEVIMADTNWIASAAPVVHLGAKPVFVDILEETWCIDAELAEAAITPRTKAIIAVHLYGNLCEMDGLLDIGEKHGIPVIEDAAEAIGSLYHGRKAGSIGRFGVFSFHGTKTVTTGEGGMFVTSDPELYEKVIMLSNHGRAKNQKRQFWPDEVGFKYKISNVQAAIGLGQIERIDSLIGKKREILKYYRDAIERLPGARMNAEPEGVTIGGWMPTVVFAPETGITFDKLREKFSALDIDARPFFHPLSSTSMFPSAPNNVNAYSIPRHSINLPSYHDMTTCQQDRIIEVIKNL